MSSEIVLKELMSEIEKGNSIDTVRYTRLILQKVSRTYALTIRSLGQPFREPVLIGYLLCRIADTYEDSPTLPFELKIKALDLFASMFDGVESYERSEKPLFNIVKDHFSSSDFEEFLAMYVAPVFQRYYSFSDAVQQIMRSTVLEMVDGMKKTVTKQHETGIIGTDSIEDLDKYCYYVAGTVGNMLTDLFAHYSPWISKDLYAKLTRYNESFGRALQLTNIIKDAMGDLKRGVSFIPKDLAREYKVDPSLLYLPEYRKEAHSIMQHLIIKASGELNRAMEYSLFIPKAEPRIRLFCVMPVFFAIQTLALAMKNDDLLDPDKKVKIGRADVKTTLKYITLYCLWDHKLVKRYLEYLNTIEEGLGVKIEHNFKQIPLLPITSIVEERR